MEFNFVYKYCETNAAEILKELRNDQYYFDVTLGTGDDKLIRAHKIISSLSSEFFEKKYFKNI